MINYIKGDATNPQGGGKKIIAHVVNNRKKWGKGFVLAVSKKWPKTREEFLKWDDDKLGSVQFIQVDNHITVANMVGQDGIKTGSKGPPVRYEAIKQCLQKVRDEAKRQQASVHMPWIGCGLAGGTKEKIKPIIEEVLGDMSVTIYEWD